MLPRSFPDCGCGLPTARRGGGVQPGCRRGDRERRVHGDAFLAREGQIGQGDLGFTDGLHAVCAIQRFTLIDREHHVALGQKHRLPPPLYQLPGIPVRHRRRVGAGGTWGAVEILGAGGCHEREEKSCERSSPSRERSGSARGTEPPPPAACDELSVLAVRGERSTLPESKATNPSVPASIASAASRTIFLIRARMSSSILLRL